MAYSDQIKRKFNVSSFKEVKKLAMNRGEYTDKSMTLKYDDRERDYGIQTEDGQHRLTLQLYCDKNDNN